MRYALSHALSSRDEGGFAGEIGRNFLRLRECLRVGREEDRERASTRCQHGSPSAFRPRGDEDRYCDAERDRAEPFSGNRQSHARAEQQRGAQCGRALVQMRGEKCHGNPEEERGVFFHVVAQFKELVMRRERQPCEHGHAPSAPDVAEEREQDHGGGGEGCRYPASGFHDGLR